jgi:DNA-binding MarR family transcriptional regulator
MNREKQIQSIVESLAKCQRPALGAGWKQLGLSHAQMGMLYLLFYHREASVKQAADFLGISKSAVTQLADPLVAKELVSRRNDPNDRRIVRLSLTANGSQVLKKLAKYKFAGIRSAIDSLEDKDIKQLYSLHQKMAENMSKENKI